MAREIEMKICLGSSCFSRGNKKIVMFIKDYIGRNHLEDKVTFRGARCMGHCSCGPNLEINGVIKEGVTASSIEGILEMESEKIK